MQDFPIGIVTLYINFVRLLLHFWREFRIIFVFCLWKYQLYFFIILIVTITWNFEEFLENFESFQELLMFKVCLLHAVGTFLDFRPHVLRKWS